MRQPNEYSVLLGKSYEELRLEAYDDGGGNWTIGWGHTSDAKLKVTPGLKITGQKADELHIYDLLEAAQIIDRELAHENDLSDNQYSALVDLAYNSGSLKVRSLGHQWVPSELLAALNNHDFNAAGEFIKTHDIRVNGRVWKGLKRRRLAEYFLYTGHRVGELAPKDWVRWARIEVDRLIA